MPFGGGNKCPKCGKTVYMAEEVLAAGNKYHKMCCKCDDCGKLLDRLESISQSATHVSSTISPPSLLAQLLGTTRPSSTVQPAIIATMASRAMAMVVVPAR